MGAYTSKQQSLAGSSASSGAESEKSSYQYDTAARPDARGLLSAQLGSASGSVLRRAGGPPGKARHAHPALSLEAIADWDKAFSSSPKAQLASTILSGQDFLTALSSRKARIQDVQVYNVKLSEEATPITNQMSSGRCWLFAITNVIRTFTARKLDLGDFQYSQSFLFFYDSLSKANWFLEQMLDLADEPLDSRTVQYLLVSPENDGGQIQMAMNLVEKFGLVPQAVFVESHNSSNSSRLNSLLTSKLREYALDLRTAYADARASFDEGAPRPEGEIRALSAAAARRLKDAQLEEIYRILAITLGAPPKPDEKFTWEYYDKKNKFHRIESTPLDFAKYYANYDISKHVSLINDPRNSYNELYTVQRLGNVVGGEPVLYLNTEIKTLKDVAIALLKADCPVWFGSDVGKFSNSTQGLMDPDLYDYEGAFDTKLGMSKAQRLITGESMMTHAMVLTAVHLDKDGKPVRWRVENSWGPDRGEKGYFLMSDSWFDEYCFQIAVDRKWVPSKLLKVLDAGNPTELPPWDPMGALA